MSEAGAQLIFAELLDRHGRIRVPLIQRDFAQGRSDQAEIRDEFLAALHEALNLPPDSDALPLNLDFIYGSVEGNASTCFQPLDGQQRLTTLFLLHWYLAWRDDCGEAFRDLCADGDTSRFSYQVRPSSKEFFDALVAYTPSQRPEEVDSLSVRLTDQPWYFRSWRLDPTIQSALVLLDAIHARFQDGHGLYARLTDIERPAITFQLLDLKNFGLSDDLYIKMNARGKPLTAFETFKARYEQVLKELFPSETRLLNGQPVRVPEYYSRRMDTTWADFFWPYRDPDSHIFDVAVMNLFRAVILITRSPQSNEFVNEINLLRDDWQPSSYRFFQLNDWLDRAFSDMLITVLDAWSGAAGGFGRQLQDKRYFDEEEIFGQILSDPTGLGYEQIVQFAAYAQFLKAQPGVTDPDAFQEWMRVVFNLVINTEYNRPADLQRSMASLAELRPHMSRILEYLAEPKSEISGFFRQQVAEEQVKARLLLADGGWRALIAQAEVHPYFRGQIGFLLEFSGVRGHPAATGEQRWVAAETSKFQAAFMGYLVKAEAMFGDKGLKSLPNCRWERALLSLGDYRLEHRRNRSFLVNLQSAQASWKRLLRGAATGSKEGAVLKRLWDKLTSSSDLKTQLDAVIAGASGLEGWRTALITTPAAIEYCRDRMMRHADDGAIYLLRKSQLNGAHAELFTYCLYQEVLQPARADGRLSVLSPYYDETCTTDDAPGVRLSGKWRDQFLRFFLQFRGGHFFVGLSGEAPLAAEFSAKLVGLGFSGDGESFSKTCSVHAIESDIFALEQLLAGAGKVGTHD